MHTFIYVFSVAMYLHLRMQQDWKWVQSTCRFHTSTHLNIKVRCLSQDKRTGEEYLVLMVYFNIIVELKLSTLHGLPALMEKNTAGCVLVHLRGGPRQGTCGHILQFLRLHGLPIGTRETLHLQLGGPAEGMLIAFFTCVVFRLSELSKSHFSI